jgi:hypothetical protein
LLVYCITSETDLKINIPLLLKVNYHELKRNKDYGYGRINSVGHKTILLKNSAIGLIREGQIHLNTEYNIKTLFLTLLKLIL